MTSPKSEVDMEFMRAIGRALPELRPVDAPGDEYELDGVSFLDEQILLVADRNSGAYCVHYDGVDGDRWNYHKHMGVTDDPLTLVGWIIEAARQLGVTLEVTA